MNIKFHFSAAIPRIPNWGGVQTPAPPTLIMHRRAVVKEGTGSTSSPKIMTNFLDQSISQYFQSFHHLLVRNPLIHPK